MRYKFLILVFLFITTIGYSQRNFTIAVEYNKEGKPLREIPTKFSYWINNKDKFVIEFEKGTFQYTIKCESNKATPNGSKFVEFDLAPDDGVSKPLIIQVFENEEYGIRMFSNAPVYYVLYQ